MSFKRCRDILAKEVELVKQVACLQNLVREAVLNRNWTDFEGHFNDLGEMGEEISALETEREQLFAAMNRKQGASMGFYAFAAHFPAKQRNELTDLYRDLKLKTLQAQMDGETLQNYITGARATMAGFFAVAFPDRGGKLYTPFGSPVSHDMRSMVLDRSF
jgi:hypothetical protein